MLIVSFLSEEKIKFASFLKINLYEKNNINPDDITIVIKLNIPPIKVLYLLSPLSLNVK